MMVCQPRQERSGTWWREPKMGLGMAGHTSEPNPLSAGIPRRPFPAFPHAKIWLSASNKNRWEWFLSKSHCTTLNAKDRQKKKIWKICKFLEAQDHMISPSVAAMVKLSPHDTLVNVFPPKDPTRTWTPWCFLKSFTPSCPYLLQPKVIRRPRAAKSDTD